MTGAHQNQKEILISVVIPTKNRARLVSQCINSVRRQSYKNIEIIVVNDGSQDNTKNIVKRKRSKDERIKYVENEKSKGGAAARNIGVEKSNGRVIAFIDDDDLWRKDKLSKQVQFIDNHSLVGSKHTVCKTITSENFYSTKTSKCTPRTKIEKQDIMYTNCGISPSSVICNVNTFNKVGGFDESLTSNQGRDFFIKVLLETYNAIRVDNPLVMKRNYHGEDRISDNINSRIETNKILLDKYKEHMTQSQIRYRMLKIELLKARQNNNLLDKIALYSSSIKFIDHNNYFLSARTLINSVLQ
ncbi:glycosyltransferase involved in cell wall biosynthesis [Salinibacter ruber]|uniref:glycosyltransferase family 2 protein n=1 Tax=Salinibacter ruber TaxID=146919 RepID=UPI00216A4453|nr:glycosyltransferase family A protein [Salinibacter ruber]MCS3855297.1 glycosyltransferase involved in cell wall biosynthesis [Salinibacter ruber]